MAAVREKVSSRKSFIDLIEDFAWPGKVGVKISLFINDSEI